MRNQINSIRAAADRMAKLRAQQPSGGSHVTQDNAISQRAAQQVRVHNPAVVAPQSLAEAIRKLKVK
jgi:hypothetical protein